jgi:hypothetical protein
MDPPLEINSKIALNNALNELNQNILIRTLTQKNILRGETLFPNNVKKQPFYRSKSLKKTRFAHLLLNQNPQPQQLNITNGLKQMQEQGTIIIQSPFPLLKLITNKMIPNNSKHLIENLIFNTPTVKHITEPNVFKQQDATIRIKKQLLPIIIKPEGKQKFQIQCKTTRNKEKEQNLIFNMTSDKEKHFLLTNSNNSCQRKESEINDNFKLSKSSAKSFKHLQENPKIKPKKIIVQPESNYARYAYKFNELTEKTNFFTKIKNHRIIKFSKSPVKNDEKNDNNIFQTYYKVEKSPRGYSDKNISFFKK